MLPQYQARHLIQPGYRGSGIGSIFFSAFKALKPLLKSAFSKVVKSKTAKNIGRDLKKSGLKASVGVASSILQGDNPKQAFKANLKRVREDTAKSLNKNLSQIINSEGPKKKRPRLEKRTKKVKKYPKRIKVGGGSGRRRRRAVGVAKKQKKHKRGKKRGRKKKSKSTDIFSY